MGVIARLRIFAVHTFRGGESQIAVETEGEEAIGLEEWGALPPEERDKWEPTGEAAILYRRKREEPPPS
jgi:hypothetical protein